jgi:hypothetical protein
VILNDITLCVKYLFMRCPSTIRLGESFFVKDNVYLRCPMWHNTTMLYLNRLDTGDKGIPRPDSGGQKPKEFSS